MWLKKLFEAAAADFYELLHQEEVRNKRLYEIYQSRVLEKKYHLEFCKRGDHRMYRIRRDTLQCVDCGFYKICEKFFNCNECDLCCEYSSSIKYRRDPDEEEI